MSAPEWFPKESLQQEIDRIKSLNESDEFKEMSINALIEKVKQLGSIKTATYDKETGKFEIVARNGLMKTYIGGDVGSQSAARASSGWANYFKKGETISVTGKYTFGGSPSVNIAFCMPDFKSVDFSKMNSFKSYTYSLNVEKKDEDKNSIQTASLEFNLNGGKEIFDKSIAVSAIRQVLSQDPPYPLKFEPHPYFKFEMSACLPSFLPMQRNRLATGLIFDTKRNVTPFIKATAFNKINLPFGLSIVGDCGLITSLKKNPGAKLSLANMYPMPYPEKFVLGGLPTIHGVESRKFTNNYEGFPIGSNVYGSLTIDESVFMFPEQNFNGHLFLSGAIAKNFSSHFPDSCDPSWTSLIVAGTGLTIVQGQAKIEVNIQKPIYQSGPKVDVLSYQIGITPA